MCVCVMFYGGATEESIVKNVKKKNEGAMRNNSVKNKKQHLEHPRTLLCVCVCVYCVVYVFTIRDKKKKKK